MRICNYLMILQDLAIRDLSKIFVLIQLKLKSKCAFLELVILNFLILTNLSNI